MEGGDLCTQALSQANRDSIEKKLRYVLATSTPGKPTRPEVEAASLARDLAAHATICRRLPLLVHDGTSLTGPSTLTLSDGRQYAVIACTHLAGALLPAAAVSKLEVAASLAEERAAALRVRLAAGCRVAVGVATNMHGLQWVQPPAQPGWGKQLLLGRGGDGEGGSSCCIPQPQKQMGAWRLAATLLTLVAAAAVGFVVGSS